MNNEFNNQANDNQQVISVEKKKANILAVLGLIFAFFIPLVGLILSIIGLVQSKKLNDGKGVAIGGIIASAIFLIIHIILFGVVFFILAFDEISDYDHSYESDANYDYRENMNYSNKKTGGPFYFVKDGEYFYSTDEKDANVNIVGKYICDSIYCTTFDVSSEYAVIYDEKDYFLYDYKKEKKRILDIPYQKYNNIFLHDNKRGNTLAMVLENEEHTDAFYDIKKNEIIIDFGEYRDIHVTPNLLEAGYIILSDDFYSEKDRFLYNLKTKQIEKNNIMGAFSNGRVTYFYDGEFTEDEGIKKVYSSDFNLITEFKGDAVYNYHFNDEDGKLLYAVDNRYYIIENNKVTYTSKVYNEVYNVFKDYVAVNKDNNLLLLDYKENEVANLVTLTKNLEVHPFLSGWYTENGKNGIYMVVADDNFVCSTLTDEDSIFNCDEFGGGYEYYYIPSTKETGRIPTFLGGYAKPVLYLYPDKDNTNIRVSFEKRGLLTTTYPKFDKYWEVVADKNGDLHDKNGRYYYGLYWEEMGSTKIDFQEGFYVSKDNAIEFLEDKTKQIGFTEREANEFIMYWLPILEKNEHNLVYFELTEERERFNSLKISPKPDSMLRVAIHVKKVNKEVSIKEQKLETFKRHGFTAVEWGGVVH